MKSEETLSKVWGYREGDGVDGGSNKNRGYHEAIMRSCHYDEAFMGVGWGSGRGVLTVFSEI